MIIVADTGAMLALLDGADRWHDALVRLFAAHRPGWVVPAVTLAELDYLVARHLGARAQDDWQADLDRGEFSIDWGGVKDLTRSCGLLRQYRSLRLGLVDTMVMACAERLSAAAIATLDLRHFGAVALAPQPRLLPRDGMQ